MMTSRNSGLNLDTLPDNVVVFPRARRVRPAASVPASGTDRQLPRPNRQPPAITGAELNARLLILLAICTTGAVLAISAAQILHG